VILDDFDGEDIVDQVMIHVAPMGDATLAKTRAAVGNVCAYMVSPSELTLRGTRRPWFSPWWILRYFDEPDKLSSHRPPRAR